MSDAPAGAPAPPSAAPVHWEPPSQRPAGHRDLGQLVSLTFGVLGRGLAVLVLLSVVQLMGIVLFVIAAVGYSDVFAALGAWNEAATIAQLTGEPVPPMPDVPGDFWAIVLVAVLVWTFVALMSFIAMVIVADDVIHGRAPSALGSLDAALGRVAPAIGVGLLWMLVFIPLALTLLIPLLLGPIGLLLWLLTFLIGGTYVGIRMIPIMPVLALEEAGPISAVGRAWQLTGRNVWLTFLFSLVMALLILILSLIVGAVAVVFTPVGGPIIGSLGSFLSSLLALPFSAVFSAVLYDELRRRHHPAPVASGAALPSTEPA
jgi:hypothetical protein